MRIDKAETVDFDLPPISGAVEVSGDRVWFRSRYPFDANARYWVTLDWRLLGDDLDVLTSLSFLTPAAPERPATTVTQIYPSSEVLPENQLRFYIHFSAPMSRGEAYKRIHLIDAAGREVDGAFLELDEELWDRAMCRFTLLCDPGRVKRGLKPREELGPVLIEGKNYTLVVDRDWPDAMGRALGEKLTKAFRVGPPDESPLDPKGWKLAAPRADSSEPLIVHFGKPLDRALAERVLSVRSAAGEAVKGRVELAASESTWRFIPTEPWPAGEYRLVADTTLEDLAGNSIGRAFDVDVFGPVQQQITTETIELPFTVASPQ